MMMMMMMCRGRVPTLFHITYRMHTTIQQRLVLTAHLWYEKGVDGGEGGVVVVMVTKMVMITVMMIMTITTMIMTVKMLMIPPFAEKYLHV